MRPTKHYRLFRVPVLLLGVILGLNCGSLLLECHGQVIDLEMDVTPQIDRLSNLYHRLNSMLHWPKSHSSGGGVQSSTIPRRSNLRQASLDSGSSQSQTYPQYVQPPPSLDSPRDLVNYANNILQKTMVGTGSQQGENFYSANTWSQKNHPPSSSSQSQGDEDFSTSSSGSGFYPSSFGQWDNIWSPSKSSSSSRPHQRPFRPRPGQHQRPSQQNSFGGSKSSGHYSSGTLVKSSYRPQNSGSPKPSKSAPSSHSSSFLGKGYKPGPPPGYEINSYRRPHPRPRRPHPPKSYSSHHPPSFHHNHHHHHHHSDIFDHDHDDIFNDHDIFGGGWGWKGPPKVIHSGWGWSPPPKDEGWGWSPPPVTEGWGWAPKCDPNAPPFKLDSYDDVPPGSTYVDGNGKVALREDLPPTLVPAPPVKFTVSANSSTLPANYSTRLMEKYEIKLNTDGTTNFLKEVHNRPSSSPVPTPASSTSTGRKSSATNTLRITTSLIESPYASAPINGSTNSNKFFERGLQARALAFKEGPPDPFVSQVDVLLDLFNQLEEYQRVQNEEEAEKEEENFSAGWGWQPPPPEQSGTSDTSSSDDNSESDLATPHLLLMVQRYSVPELDSREGGMLDAAFNFGLQANRYTFGDLELISNGWKGVAAEAPTPLNLTSLGGDATSLDGIQDELNTRVRGYVKSMREASSTAYEPAEEMAYKEGFEQHQYFIIPNGVCLEPIDPPKFKGAASSNCAYGPVSLNQAAPCLPPRC